MKEQRNDYRTTVYIGTVNGKKIYKTLCASSKAELDIKVSQYKVEKHNGKDVWTKAYFGQWSDKWFNEVLMLKGLTDNSIERERHNIKVLNSRFSNVELKKIKLADFQSFVNEITLYEFADNGIMVQRDKPLSKDTVKKIIQTAKKICDYASANDLVAPSFFSSVIVPNVAAAPVKRRALTEEEIQMIIDTPHRCQLSAMIMLFSGLRRAELCALTWSDINLNKGYISVTKTLDMLAPSKDKVKIKQGGKTANATRVVPIPQILIDYLRDYKQAHQLGIYVCTDTNGNLFTSRNFRNMWDSYILDLNVKYGYPNQDVSKYNPNGLPMKIERFTAHYLRHTYATLLYLQGISPVDAMQYLGHGSIDVTVDIYTDIKSNSRITLSDTYKNKLSNEYKILVA